MAIVKLKVSDRINIINNAQKLGCTWPVRCKFDEFIDTVNVSDEEYEKAGVGRDENGKIVVKDDFTVDYDTSNVPDVIAKAIANTIINLEETSVRVPTMTPVYDEVKNSLGLIVNVSAL